MNDKLSLRWHRFLGVAIGFFILIAALSGSIIAFYHTLDAKINPWQISTSQTTSLPSDPLSHIGVIEQTIHGARVGWVSLSLNHQSSWNYFLVPQQLNKPIENNEVYVDPYTGAIKGMRLWGDITQGWINLLPFIYKVHYSLGLGGFGTVIMGFAALAWLVVVIGGLWLTFPKPNALFLSQWAKSWRWRFHGSMKAKTYGWHKSAGLWGLPFLVILAWSSFALNLHELHEKMLSPIASFQTQHDAIKLLRKPRLHPKIEWITARDIARGLMQEVADKEGFDVLEESYMMYDALKGVYVYGVKSSRDVGNDHGETSVYLDAQTGLLKAVFIPTKKASGDTLMTWLSGLHKGSIFGVAHRVVMSMLCVVVALMIMSGYYLWWKRTHKHRHGEKINKKMT